MDIFSQRFRVYKGKYSYCISYHGEKTIDNSLKFGIWVGPPDGPIFKISPFWRVSLFSILVLYLSCCCNLWPSFRSKLRSVLLSSKFSAYFLLSCVNIKICVKTDITAEIQGFLASDGFCGYKLNELITQYIISDGENLPSVVKWRLPRVKKSSDTDVRRPEGLDVTAIQIKVEHQWLTIKSSLKRMYDPNFWFNLN